MGQIQTFLLEIIRPRSVEQIAVQYVTVQGLDSNFTVGPGHTPLIAVLHKQGLLTYFTKDGEKKKIEVSGGIFLVKSGNAVCIFSD